MGLKADDQRPPYVQIAEQIRQGIADGTYQPGEKLPTGRQLEAEWGVAINTVQRAINELQREGLIYGIQGKGNFVRSDVDAGALSAVSGSDLQQQVRQLNDELDKVKKRVAKLERKTKVID